MSKVIDCVTLTSTDPLRGGDYYLEFLDTPGGIEYTVQRLGATGLEPAYIEPKDIGKAAKRLAKMAAKAVDKERKFK